VWGGHLVGQAEQARAELCLVRAGAVVSPLVEELHGWQEWGTEEGQHDWEDSEAGKQRTNGRRRSGGPEGRRGRLDDGAEHSNEGVVQHIASGQAHEEEAQGR